MRHWLLGLWLLPGLALGNPLEAFLEGLHTLEASFTQVVMDEEGQVLERSEGKVWLMRPGRFRWEYQRPYHQLILYDGKRLWIYDPELEQVTVKPLERLGETPAKLLAGDEPLEGFEVKTLPGKDGMTWVRLTPKSRKTGFESLTFGFKGGMLATMVLEDSLGHVTTIDFGSLKRNLPLDEALFTFTPPPGIDVFDETR